MNADKERAERALDAIEAAIARNAPADEMARLKREALKYHTLARIQRVIRIRRAALALQDHLPAEAPLHPLNIDTSWLGICIVCREPSRGSPCRRCKIDPDYRAKWLDQDGQPLPWYVE